MRDAQHVVELVLVVATVCAVARRFGLPAPILLVIVGTALSFVPAFPTFALDPELVLVFILPPLLYAAAFNASVPAFRANLRPIGLLSIGLVLFTTLVVGLVAVAVVPDLPLAAAFALGAIVAPPDAVAATGIARRVRLPDRLVTILEGESLLNDATALVTYRIAVVAAVTGTASALDALGDFVQASAGGLAVGLAGGWLIGQIRRQIRDPVLDGTISLITPYVVYLPAERLHASGILAVVIAGLYLGHRAPVLMTPAARLVGRALWQTIEFLLQGVVFLLIGLQLRAVSRAAEAGTSGTVVAAIAVTGAVILSRFVWIYPATYLARLVRRVRARDPAPPWQLPFALSWAGMRGVVSLAAAFALPVATASGAPFPQRDLLLFVTFVVIAVTLGLQGLSLPVVIRWLKLSGPDPTQLHLQEAAAQHAAASAALRRLDELLAGSEQQPPAGVEDRLRDQAERRRLFAWERLGDQTTREVPSRAYQRLRHQMLAAEREVFVASRDAGRIDEQVLQRVLYDLDLEEAMLLRDTP